MNEEIDLTMSSMLVGEAQTHLLPVEHRYYAQLSRKRHFDWGEPDTPDFEREFGVRIAPVFGNGISLENHRMIDSKEIEGESLMEHFSHWYFKLFGQIHPVTGFYDPFAYSMAMETCDCCGSPLNFMGRYGLCGTCDLEQEWLYGDLKNFEL